MRISVLALVAILAAASAGESRLAGQPATRPNILFVIADDWSSDAGVLGNAGVRTPAFDRVAKEGVRFDNAFVAAPSCTPSRAAILTGRWPHQLEEGANLHGTLPAKFDVYPDLLEQAGYAVGLTGKGWGPGDFKAGGRTRNPAGPNFPSFAAFLKQLPAGRPFAYWIGPSDPHRPYEAGAAREAGLKPGAVRVPATLPDVPPVRADLLDYYFEVERFDKALGEAIALLEQTGRLDDTIVIATSDNGRPFPRDKASVHDGGSHVPLAIRWPRAAKPRRVDAFVSLTDIAPTVLEAAGLKPPASMAGRSLLPLVQGTDQNGRDHVFVERERHAFVRAGNASYPVRAVRTNQYFYVRNLAPDRWPAGDPVWVQSVGPFGDVDHGPSKDFILAYRDDPAIAPFYALAFAKRPGEELYDLASDPDELVNVADRPEHAAAKASLRRMLDDWMVRTGDPRARSDADPFSAYRYFGAGFKWPTR